jgi:hypothetical protein
MSRQEQTPPHGTGGSSSPHDLVGQLFAVGLDIHQALRLIDHDIEHDDAAGPHLRSVLARLDEMIATVLHTGLARALSGEFEVGRLVTDTFLQLTLGVTSGFDLAGYLRALTGHGTALPDVRAAAIILGDADETPSLVVLTPHQPTLKELCRLRPSPAWDTYLSGEPQTVADLSTDIRWPLFAARAKAAGHQAVHTMPLRRRTTVLGALTLFHATPGTLPPASRRIAHRLAALATIGVLLHGSGRLRLPGGDSVTDVASIHHAEGMLAERHHIPVAEAAAALAFHARRHRLRLADMARALLDGTLDPGDSVIHPAASRDPSPAAPCPGHTPQPS